MLILQECALLVRQISLLFGIRHSMVVYHTTFDFISNVMELLN